MKLRHLGLAVLVMAVWGTNFVPARVALNRFGPLTLCSIRFFLAAFPAVFLLPRPRCSWRLLFGFGIVLFGLQFGFLFTALKIGMSPGLASLLMQFQAFFTLALAAWIFHDRPDRWKLMGAGVAFLGIALVALHTGGEVSLMGLTLTLLGAFSWAVGNIISKKIGGVNPLALVTWGSLVACPPMMALAFGVEGLGPIRDALLGAGWMDALAVAYVVYCSTHLAYSLWGFLLSRYPASTVAPFTLLVPVFGFVSAAVLLGEPFPLWKLVAACLVLMGLGLNVAGTRWAGSRARRRRSDSPVPPA